ncbi:MAG: amidohydrolase family protein [Verrucomicrobia bacterium]|nr:amidohydrolase family protein [Verrucomicrobiota bacterium]
MKPIHRRSFLKSSLLSAAAVSLPNQPPMATQNAARSASVAASSQAPGIIDTNVNLFSWPFRALKYGATKALVAKLKKHRVIEAWAGSFEALLAKDMSGVNSRLAAECREHARGFLIPFGSVNLAWPDWEEDVRRCHEVHQMPGIRIYPGYQPFDLDHPGMQRLVRMTAERGLILQVVFGMEDPRVHHPMISVGPVTFAPLLRAVESTPNANVELLHFSGSVRGEDSNRFTAQTNVFLDISRLEGNGAVARLTGSIQGLPSARLPLERIVFGSHAPYFPVETAILKLIESPLDAQQLQAIMQGNARRLLPRA